jgi:hypothetical protein
MGCFETGERMVIINDQQVAQVAEAIGDVIIG